MIWIYYSMTDTLSKQLNKNDRIKDTLFLLFTFEIDDLFCFRIPFRLYVLKTVSGTECFTYLGNLNLSMVVQF
jgi:hypothetical protein